MLIFSISSDVMCSTKIFLAMIFNEIKCHVNTSLGLVGGCTPCIPPVSAPVFYAMTLSPHKRQFHDF